MSLPAQRSFAGGEVAPALYARTDQVKYATGLRTCRNMIVRRHGGASNRPGTQFLASTKNSALACRLLRFVRDGTNIGDTYVIELGDRYARFFQNGGAIATSGVSAWANTTVYAVGDLVTYASVTYYCISAHTSTTATDRPSTGSAWQTRWYAQAGTTYEIPMPYALADLPDVQFAQKGDVITLVHPSYPAQELRRYTHTRWIVAPIVYGPVIAAPTNLQAAGTGAASFQRYYAVTAVREGTLEESLAATVAYTKVVDATTPVTLTWNVVPGAISYNVYRSTDGVTFGLITSAGGLPTQSSDGTWTDSSETASSSDPSTWTPAAGQLQNVLGAITATERAYNGQYVVSFAYTVSGSSGADGLIEARYNIYYKRDTDAVRVLALTSPSIFFDPDGFVGAPSYGPVAVLETIDVPDNGYTTLRIEVVPEVVGPRASGTGSFNVDASAGAVSWSAQDAGFVDTGATPDFALAPPAPSLTFANPAQYPAATTNYQQRRLLAGPTGNPDTVYASRIGSPASFALSTPLQDDDLVQFTVESDEAQAVKHLLDVGRLLVFTSAGIFQCGDADGVLTPSTPNPKSIDSNGIGRIRPLKVGDSAVFVEGRQSTVRDLQPWQAGGALGGYSGKDLTVFAAHLFDGYTLVDWAYAKTPHSVIWAVRSDGVLLGLTYLREHELWAWHRHDTDGVIENVCVVPEGREDAVYLVVRRTINGATARYVERMASRFFADPADARFVDCALSYDGRNTSAATMRLSGSTSWASTEALTVTCVGATPFVSTNVGDSVVFTAADGSRVEIVLEGFTSSAVMTGRPTRTVPVELQATATTTWTLAVAKVGGLAHLEGKSVSVLGDGFVDASPNNSVYAVRTVTGGQVALGRAYGRIHVGLPYISDLETLDLDSPGPRSLKDKKVLVGSVGVFVEASRGIWAGRSAHITAAAPLAGLQEQKPRSTENYAATPDAFTGFFEITIDSSWDNNGGVLVRQVDPVPMTILAAMPGGFGITGS